MSLALIPTLSSSPTIKLLADDDSESQVLLEALKEAGFPKATKLDCLNLLHLVENKSYEVRILIVDLDTISTPDISTLLNQNLNNLTLVLLYNPNHAESLKHLKTFKQAHIALPKPFEISSLLNFLSLSKSATELPKATAPTRVCTQDELAPVHDLNNFNTVIMNSFDQIQELLKDSVNLSANRSKAMTCAERGYRAALKLKKLSSQLQSRIKSNLNYK